MEKIKIYLSIDESKEYLDSNDLFSGISIALKHFFKVKKLVNLKKYNILEVDMIEEVCGLYSIMLRLEEKKDAKK